MDVSVFLARVFSIYLVVLGVGILFNQQWYQKTIQELLKHSTSVFLIAILNLIIGSLLVIAHPEFTLDWRSIITILAWLGLIKGVLYCVFPEHMQVLKRTLLSYAITYRVVVLISLILGAYLGYLGFIFY